MLNAVQMALDRLRKRLAGRTERAYADRDAKVKTPNSQSYAAGEAHAYGVAEDDVRDTQREIQDEDRT